jgi:hypothetical protein
MVRAQLHCTMLTDQRYEQHTAVIVSHSPCCHELYKSDAILHIAFVANTEQLIITSLHVNHCWSRCHEACYYCIATVPLEFSTMQSTFLPHLPQLRFHQQSCCSCPGLMLAAYCLSWTIVVSPCSMIVHSANTGSGSRCNSKTQCYCCACQLAIYQLIATTIDAQCRAHIDTTVLHAAPTLARLCAMQARTHCVATH